MKFIVAYFNEEKIEAFVFVAIGLAALLLGIYFWFGKQTDFLKGAAIALILIALIQLTVGGIIIVRSPKDIIRVQQIVKSEPARITSEELPRMEVVMKNFIIYSYVELALMALGLILFFISSAASFWKGLGIALFIQAALMLAFDHVAEARGKKYIAKLQSIKTA
jgi:multidrug transporter EmrE-like cation transporter